MAIVSSIAVGKARKSAGNVTFTTSKGRVIMKEKAVYVANPKTPKQLKQRSKMARTVQAWQRVGMLAKSGYTVTSKYGSAYNAFTTANIGAIDTISPVEKALVDTTFVGLQIAHGAHEALSVLSGTDSDSVLVQIVGLSANSIGAKVGDKIVAIMWDKALATAKVKEHTLTANDLIADEIEVAIVLDDITLSNGGSCGAYLLTADGKKSTSANMIVWSV